jgi:hypothetical protein
MAAVNQDFPNANDMLVVNESNEPIEAATIRVFEQSAFTAGVVDTWVAETTTDVDGKWVDPIILDDGKNWIVHFQKESVYGPVHVEITT